MWKSITSEPIIFLYSIVYVINLSILPQLVLQKVCLQQVSEQNAVINVRQYNTSSSTIAAAATETELCYTQTDSVMTAESKKESARWWFFVLASGQFPAIITVLIWGPISDVIGRKKAMLVIPVVSILQNVVFVMCAYYTASSVIYLCFGMFLSCLFGEFPGVIALSCAFIADVTAGRNAKSRMARMAFVDGAINLAGIPAGLFAGQLLKRVGFTAVFGLSIGVNVMLLLYITCLLPDPKKLIYKAKEVFDDLEMTKGGEHKQLVAPNTEVANNNESTSSSSQTSGEEVSLQQSSTSINWDLLKPHKQIHKVCQVITAKERRHLILPPLLAFSFVIYSFVGELTTTALYLRGNPLAMSPDIIGYYYAAQACIRGVGVVATTQFAYRVLKISDINTLLFGIGSQIVCYVLIAFSKNTISVFFANLTGFSVAVGISLSRSYTSKHVPPEQIGTLMAAFEALDALSFTTNLISLEIYSLTLDIFPGTVFLFLSGCAMIGFFITLANKYYLKKHAREINADLNRQLNEGLNE